MLGVKVSLVNGVVTTDCISYNAAGEVQIEGTYNDAK